MVSPNDHVVMNHQNQTRTNGIWGHVRYNLPLFGDLWQHNQSKHKFAKFDRIITTYTFLDAYHHPNSPYMKLPLFDLYVHILPLWSHILKTTCKLKPQACFGPTFSPFGIKSPKSPNQKGPMKLARPRNKAQRRDVKRKGESRMNHDPYVWYQWRYHM
jgi:hypothetical protein